ncbi:MAG: hypothetical protein PHG05_00165 [Candidatus Nanoarchaeia archaeon]|nr:hypothetical protein [Candidatus Nanoarchaeia archaeon]
MKRRTGLIIFSIILGIISIGALFFYFGKLQDFGFLFTNLILGIIITLTALYHIFFSFKRFKFFVFFKKLLLDLLVIILALLPTLIKYDLLKFLNVTLVLDIQIWVLALIGLLYAGYCIADFLRKQYI